MKHHLLALALSGAAVASAATATAADWITAPSFYSHDPESGERVTQYTPIGPFYIYPRADYVESGYRHTQSVIRDENSADRIHIVRKWGQSVRPYGEWQFPYRPYSVPYNQWGPPYGGLGQWPGQYGRGGFGGFQGRGGGQDDPHGHGGGHSHDDHHHGPGH